MRKVTVSTPAGMVKASRVDDPSLVRFWLTGTEMSGTHFSRDDAYTGTAELAITMGVAHAVP